VKETICVDLETSGLSPLLHQAVEVAWQVLETGENGAFIPPHTLDNADPAALSVNNYWERLWRQSDWDEDGIELRRFHAARAALAAMFQGSKASEIGGGRVSGRSAARAPSSPIAQ